MRLEKFRNDNPGIKWLIDAVNSSYEEIHMNPKIRASRDALPALIVSHVKKKYPEANKQLTKKIAKSVIKIKNMG